MMFANRRVLWTEDDALDIAEGEIRLSDLSLAWDIKEETLLREFPGGVGHGHRG